MRDLNRFVLAQESSYDRALAEVKDGCKRSHWMWYIFPQIAGLGQTSTSRLYAIDDLEEAQAYLRHPVLGPRLLEISEALLALNTDSVIAVFGWPDDMKLRSCMTLFAQADPEQEIFQKVLDKFYGGKPDTLTLDLLGL